ncbi:hypothetical protein VRRI112168_00265 [Vreelandella rituensis]|uniref:Uncharacterized protein n=1 Tax=Vreelandella rituensis TaxID=2282306 RepID=A0A368U9H0_9GAMM|nr:hypothetical protein [Halomonas rituensis]RCV93868.1 hypothetical protein DU506_01540 [Halomonas rituensis]
MNNVKKSTALLPMITLMTFLASGLLAHSATKAQQTLQDKADRQERINVQVAHHLDTYEELSAQAKDWDHGFRHINEAKDVLGLYRLLNLRRFGLASDLGQFHLTSDSPFLVKKQHIGLIEVCVASQGDRLLVQAEDYTKLMQGLGEMARAEDITFDGLTIYGDRELGEAELSNVCMLLRDRGDA